MASNAVEQLKRLVAPPSRPSGEPAWQRFRDEFGCAPPSDYAQFVKDYGLGSFDNFLWVFHPSSREHLDIVGESQSRLLALRELIGAGEQVPYAIGDGRSEVIPWACTDNGDVCFWVVSPGVSPDEWTVAVNESRGPDWVAFDGSMSEFLVAVLSGATPCSIFPDDFPSDEPEFSPIAK